MFGRCLHLLSGPGLLPLCEPYCLSLREPYRAPLDEPHRSAPGEPHRVPLNVAYCLALNVNISKCDGDRLNVRRHGMGRHCCGMLQRLPKRPTPWYAPECCGMLQRLTVWWAPWYARTRVSFCWWLAWCPIGSPYRMGRLAVKATAADSVRK